MATKNNNGVSGWTGWVAFAAIMLIVLGSFHAIAGIVALFQSDIYVNGANSIWILSYTSWGWTHILWGLLAVWAGSSLASGNMYGRIFAVVVAVVSAIVSLAFVPVYPIWSILIIAIDVCIIYAVTVHGKEMKKLEE